MIECSPELKKLTPLRRAVLAAVADTYEDVSKVQQQYGHWAVRGLKKLQREVLRTGRRSAILTVNPNTNTATLPIDFDEEYFVGIIDDNGHKVPISSRSDIPDYRSIQDATPETKCSRCGQSDAICNDLKISEETTLVNVGGGVYEQTVIKKMHPNGDVYLETTIPVINVDSQAVEYITQKEFIAAIDLRPCGCVEETTANIEKIKCLRFDTFCTFFSKTDSSCSSDYGSYRIFEDSGIIQFDKAYKFKYVYIEYRGILKKIGGVYYIPEVAFEAIVEWIKFMAIDGKQSVSAADKQWRFSRYVIEKGNLRKILGRVSIAQIIQLSFITPKFDWDSGYISPRCCASAPTVQAAPIQSAIDSSVSVTQPIVRDKILTPFQIPVVAGIGSGPASGQSVYQNDALKGALNLNYILVDSTTYTKLAGDFTFDSVAGIIDISPNQWFNQVLIVPFDKYI